MEEQDMGSVGREERPSPTLADVIATPSGVWIVIGTTGEYSDRTEWCVYAFPTEQSAKDYVGLLSATYHALGGGSRRLLNEQIHAIEVKMATLDPGFICDYTGTSWHIQHVIWAPEGVATTPGASREATKREAQTRPNNESDTQEQDRG